MVRDYFVQTAFSFRRFSPDYVPYSIDAAEAAKRRAEHRSRAGQPATPADEPLRVS
jgi:hypothetical protein